YVRIRDSRTGTTSSATITATTTSWVWPSATVSGAMNEWGTICVDAYVTGGTGYITSIWIYVHPLPVLFAVTSPNQPGANFVDIRGTTAGNLKVAISEDFVGLARDSTVAATRLRGGTLNTFTLTLTPTAALIVGANGNRVAVALFNGTPGTVYVGPSSASAKFPVAPGAAIVLNYTGALYGYTTATGTVYVMELAY
ncbi:hypothetical protein, partial [Pyrobaculum sp.]|uniref:hypothetical protein n=1 Tax=Pyrobaculum sp. TaxID=2004705 RepID=UPI003D0A4E17